MTSQEIQQLIDRYLEGITTPDEERQLARELQRNDLTADRGEMAEGRNPEEWQAVRLMLGELVMGEAAYDDIMERRHSATKVVSLRRRWWWVAAACLIAVLSLHIIYNHKDMKREQPMLAQQQTLPSPQGDNMQTLPSPQGDNMHTLPSPQGDNMQTLPSPQGEGLGVGSVTKATERTEKAEAPPPTPPLEGRGVAARGPIEKSGVAARGSLEKSGVAAPNVGMEAKPIYATYTEDDDSTGYLPPARVDEFIGKLAAYHHIEATVLNDSTAHSVAYVFPDNDKVRLFDRLLQVACSYHYDSPGYQMTISQQQLLFTLEDTRLSCRYLWLAERIGGGRIILYATHAPTGAAVSSEAYQEFRERTTHTNQITEL